MNKVIALTGPTATGKTSIGIEIAKLIDAEIINFDSLLFYKELNVASAKPTLEEMQGIPHHLVSTHSVKDPINAADFYQLCRSLINEIHQRNKIVLLVGGSGFYLQAILYGMFDSSTTPSEILTRSEKLYQKDGIHPFRDILKECDHTSYQQYHENDHYRIRRAVEHFWTTGMSFSQAREEKLQARKINQDWDVFMTYLDIPKNEHLKIIEKRTHHMFEQGLVAEVQNILAMGLTGSEKPLRSIGTKEVIEYLNGEFEDLAACKERISISTRQLAKSQRTWFKKIEKNEYNALTQRDKIIQDCLKFAAREYGH